MIKKISQYLFISVFLCIFLIGCSSGKNLNVNIDELYQKVEEASDFKEMVEITKSDFNNYYNLDLNQLESFKLKLNSSGGFPDELIIVKSKSKDYVNNIKKVFEQRKQQIRETFVNYQPQEIYKVDKSVIYSEDNYVIFVVSSKSDQSKKAFIDGFKKS